MPAPRPERRPLAALLGFLALAIATLAIYWPGLRGGYLFDDFPNLVNDPDWQITSLRLAQLQRAFGEGIASGLGRGLAMVSFGLNHLATGLDPWPMKLTNVAMHIGTGALAYALTRRLVARLAPDASATACALFVAGAWLLHPLQVSTVLYVVQRMEIGAAFFVLASCLAYWQARERQLDGRVAWPWLAAGIAAMAIGLGFKESALLAPAFALLVEAFAFGFRARTGTRSRAWIAVHGGIVLAALLAYVAIVLPRYAAPGAYAGRSFDLHERLLTQARVLAMYLGQIVLPLPARMRFYYDDFAVSTGWLAPATTLWSMLLLVALVVLAVAVRRRAPLVSLGIAWFLVAHTLTSNVVPLELAFEHRNYLALLGIAWAAVDVGRRACRRLNADARGAIAALVLLVLGGACLLQAATWGNPTRLAVEFDARAPGSPRAAYALGEHLYGLSRGDAASPAWSMAMQSFRHSAALPGSSILAEQALILAGANAGRRGNPADWDTLRHKLTSRVIRPEEVSALYALVACALRPACAIDRSELQRTLDVAVRHSPGDPDLRVIDANFLFNVAARPADAVDQARAAVRLAPARPAYRVALAKMLLASDLHNRPEAGALIAGLRSENRHGELDADLAEIARLEASTTATSGGPRGTETWPSSPGSR